MTPEERTSSDHWKYAVLFAVVLLSRLPFLNAGYGVEIDGWRVALAARHIAQNGVYEVSRFPGYPLQELICSLLWKGGPVAVNGMAAVLAAISAVLFAKIVRHLGGRAPFAAALTLAFVPLFYISSVGAKDYLWAITALLASLWFVLQRRPLLAGVCLGLAVGCRITSAAMALPLAVLLAWDNRQIVWRRFGWFAVASAGTAALAFLPVAWRYGSGFLQFYHAHEYPDAMTVLHRATIEVWGAFGLVSLAIACLAACKAWPRRCSSHLFAAGLAFALISALFLRLPDQAGYLLPFVVLTLLVLAVTTPQRVYRISAAIMVIASFVTFSNGRFAAGPILQDRTERLKTMAQIESFLGFAETLPGRNVIVVGGWAPQIEVLRPDLRDDMKCTYLLSRDQLLSFREKGFAIWYLPAIRSFNYRVNSYDLAAEGAQDLRAYHTRMLAEKSAH